MNLPHITTKQQALLRLIYQHRFLERKQIQAFLINQLSGLSPSDSLGNRINSMKILQRVPKWVKYYPVEQSRKALLILAKSDKASFGASREMHINLCDIAPDSKDLPELIHKATEAGWVCSTFPQDETSDKVVLNASKSQYVMTEETFTHDTLFFRRLADMYHVTYDGWFVSNTK